jgi:hypothetical protein
MWTETATGCYTNDPNEIAQFYQQIVGQQDKKDQDKKKKEEEKKKEEIKKKEDANQKENDQKMPYHLSEEDMDYIIGLVTGSAGGLTRISKEIGAAIKTGTKLFRLYRFYREWKLSKLAKDMMEWVGEGAIPRLNKAGDLVIVSENGARRIRFDINNPAPHNNIHTHIDEKINGKWIESGQLYPKGVPNN